jgi:hypothetical protein
MAIDSRDARGLGRVGELGEKIFKKTPRRMGILARDLGHRVALRLQSDEISRPHRLRHHHQAYAEALAIDIDERHRPIDRNHLGWNGDAHSCNDLMQPRRRRSTETGEFIDDHGHGRIPSTGSCGRQFQAEAQILRNDTYDNDPAWRLVDEAQRGKHV